MSDIDVSQAAKTLAAYDAVHIALEENGERWDKLDESMTWGFTGYEEWDAYMTQRLKNLLRGIVLQAKKKPG